MPRLEGMSWFPALIAVAAMTSAVAAEPELAHAPRHAPSPPNPRIDDLRRLFPEGWLDFTPGATARHPAFGGGTAFGIVVEPAPHPDARRWPAGMVIAPPPSPDRNVIAPGASGLNRAPRRAR
jgi:hypothetical protein